MKSSAEAASIAFAKMTQVALEAAGIRSQAEADELITSVLAYADEWFAGKRSLADVRATFTAEERFLAARFVRPHPPALRALFDALAAETGVVFDRCGRAYPEPDGPGLGRTVRYEDGKPIATFTADAAFFARKPKRAAATTDRSDLATRSAWRTSLPVGDRE